MEISNEIKFKVFAQYLGQKVTIPNNYQFSGYKTDASVGELTGVQNEFIKINDISGFYPVSDFKLILKPLSAITDEDAMEVANICNGGNGIKRIHKYEYKNKDEAKFFIELKGEFEDDKNNTLIFFYECGRIDKFYPDAGNKGEYFDLSSWQSLSVYQFLQSKGYDLPQYLLGNKTLHESGLAIYE